MIHFCDVPSVALCGADLTVDDYKRFYTNTTNCFANVTCRGCREKITTIKLAPRGFSNPLEWGQNR